MDTVLGLNGFAPPWSYEYGSAGVIALSASRPMLALEGWVEVGPEVGVAQRFGRAFSQEVWAAARFRYHRFPWDRWLARPLHFLLAPTTLCAEKVTKKTSIPIRISKTCLHIRHLKSVSGCRVFHRQRAFCGFTTAPVDATIFSATSLIATRLPGFSSLRLGCVGTFDLYAQESSRSKLPMRHCACTTDSRMRCCS